MGEIGKEKISRAFGMHASICESLCVYNQKIILLYTLTMLMEICNINDHQVGERDYSSVFRNLGVKNHLGVILINLNMLGLLHLYKLIDFDETSKKRFCPRFFCGIHKFLIGDDLGIIKLS